jgi:5-methylcytosine-specific restriction endonuclease McrA
VNRIPKQRRLRLKVELYERLREQVVWRDGWRCQYCGSSSSLEVRHEEFRSHGGDDSEENLITLCAACHSGAHSGTRLLAP